MITLPVELILPERFWQPARIRFTEDYRYLDYIIKRGFVTDGASVPWFLWWLFPPLGKYARAAVLHDYLLVNGFPREFCDAEYLRAMKYDGVWPWVARWHYAGVRLRSYYLSIKRAMR